MNWLRERILHRQARDLNEYWDATVRLHPVVPVPPADLESNLTTPIRHIHALVGQDSGVTEYEERLLGLILERQQEKTMSNSMSIANQTVPIAQIWPNSRPAMRPRPFLELGSGVARMISITAAIALMILASIAVFEAFGDGGGRFGNHSGGPAILAPATPDPTEETLFEMTIPANAMPVGDAVSAGLALTSVPVGAESSWIPVCCDGPFIIYVLEGNLTVQAGDPFQVRRADSAIEEVAADTDAVLGPGDGLLSRNGSTMQTVNNGIEPVVLMHWFAAVEDGAISGRTASTWEDIRFPDVKLHITLPITDTTVQIRMVQIKKFDPTHADEHVLQQFVGADEGVSPTAGRDGTYWWAGGTDDDSTWIYVLTLDQPASSSATPAA